MYANRVVPENSARLQGTIQERLPRHAGTNTYNIHKVYFDVTAIQTLLRCSGQKGTLATTYFTESGTVLDQTYWHCSVVRVASMKFKLQETCCTQLQVAGARANRSPTRISAN